LIISRLVLLRTRNVSNKSCRENQNTHLMFSNFFSKIALFVRRGKILHSRIGHRSGARALHAEYTRLQIHTRRICNICCFYTATMAARMRLNVTLYVHFLSCCYYVYSCDDILLLLITRHEVKIM